MKNNVYIRQVEPPKQLAQFKSRQIYGTGFTPYTGLRYQKGNGFMGRIWRGVALPLIKYIGRNGIEAAGNIISEVQKNPEGLKEIVVKEAKKMAGRALEDGGKRLSTYVQDGKGYTKIPPKSIKAGKVKRKKKTGKPERFLSNK